jgi:hypothetical protein
MKYRSDKLTPDLFLTKRPSVVMLKIVVMCAIILGVVMLSVMGTQIRLIAVIKDIQLSVILFTVIQLNVVKRNVMEPSKNFYSINFKF